MKPRAAHEARPPPRDLRRADLRLADLIGADLREADLSGADLTGCLFLTQSQVDAAKGDAANKLSPSLRRPRTGRLLARNRSLSGLNRPWSLSGILLNWEHVLIPYQLSSSCSPTPAKRTVTHVVRSDQLRALTATPAGIDR